jgi:hypothetical protein
MAAPPVRGQSQEKPKSELPVALAGFIHAFDDRRRAEFETGFRRVFEQIRAGRTPPPYMDIQPEA